MKKKVVISSGLILLLLGGFYVYKTPQATPFLIKEGTYPMTVQFVSDTPGFVNIVSRKDSLLLEGSSYSSDSSGYIQINGHIEENVPDSFQFVGTINMFAFQECCGLIDKTGKWTFRRMENRPFFRLKERDNLCSCDTCCIYLDIHTNKK
jgi:hypothetical protein